MSRALRRPARSGATSSRTLPSGRDERWGLGYDDVRTTNPSVIYCRCRCRVRRTAQRFHRFRLDDRGSRRARPAVGPAGRDPVGPGRTTRTTFRAPATRSSLCSLRSGNETNGRRPADRVSQLESDGEKHPRPSRWRPPPRWRRSSATAPRARPQPRRVFQCKGETRGARSPRGTTGECGTGDCPRPARAGGRPGSPRSLRASRARTTGAASRRSSAEGPAGAVAGASGPGRSGMARALERRPAEDEQLAHGVLAHLKPPGDRPMTALPPRQEQLERIGPEERRRYRRAHARDGRSALGLSEPQSRRVFEDKALGERRPVAVTTRTPSVGAAGRARRRNAIS